MQATGTGSIDRPGTQDTDTIEGLGVVGVFDKFTIL